MEKYQIYEDMSNEEKTEVINSINMYVRKTAHFTIYAILSFFTTTAAFTYSVSFKNTCVSVGICALYAFTDEFHQLFVPGRAGMIRDVFIDTTGAVLGAFIVFILYFMLKNFINFYRLKK